MGREPKIQTCSSIQKTVSQKSYERKLQKKAKILPTKQDKLEENKDLEEMEEEEGIDLERGGGYPRPEQGDPKGHIPNEIISVQNQSRFTNTTNWTWNPSNCSFALLVPTLRTTLV
jgi:uncharacterized protein YwqG